MRCGYGVRVNELGSATSAFEAEFADRAGHLEGERLGLVLVAVAAEVDLAAGSAGEPGLPRAFPAPVLGLAGA